MTRYPYLQLQQFKGLIFDMDGVFVDTEPLQFENFRQVFAPLGIHLPDDYMYHFVGEPTSKNLQDIARDYGVELDRTEYVKNLSENFHKIFAQHAPEALPGIWEIVYIAKTRNMKTALCTSSTLREMTFLFDKLLQKNRTFSHVDEIFNAVVTSEQLINKKPHPEPYLTACRRLGLEPQECVVIEDSLPGIQSAKDAGCFCVGLRKPYNKQLQTSIADVVCDDLVQLLDHIQL
ncbi:MAG TPA: HAD family phosphatase [bacterium]|nr:HAD family phosphatase [bacterium]HPN43837.1 HAD family phosphatase [bacterium]